MEENKNKSIAGLSYFVLNSIKAIHFITVDTDINLMATFFFNFGCSHHFGCWKKDFMELQSYTGRPLKGFAEAWVTPGAIGTIKLSCFVNNKNVNLYLHDTLYVSEKDVNLIFMSKLGQKEQKWGLTMMI